jgi:hypothetical protein
LKFFHFADGSSVERYDSEKRRGTLEIVIRVEGCRGFEMNRIRVAFLPPSPTIREKEPPSFLSTGELGHRADASPKAHDDKRHIYFRPQDVVGIGLLYSVLLTK